MSDRETLERFMDDGIWRPKVLEAAIRRLLEENKQLKADVLYEQERNHNNVHAYQDRIDAALARHFPRYPHGRDNPGFCADCIAPYPCPTFKDLKGEK